MNKLLLIFFASLIFLAVFYFFISRSNEKKAALGFQQHCGTCHLAPDPRDLTKDIWENKVLPDMGARLGMTTPGFHPYDKLSYEEQLRLIQHRIYTGVPVLSEKEWADLKKYIIKMAPEQLEHESPDTDRDLPLRQFSPQLITLDDNPGSFVSCLQFDTTANTLYAGDGYGNVFSAGNGANFRKHASISSPVVAVTPFDSSLLITGIGRMPPSELKSGRLFFAEKNGVMALIKDTLHRPVFTLTEDMDEDGSPEIIVCEYGNQTGQLTLFQKNPQEEDYRPRILLPLPGTIRVICEDMNSDGKKDLVVLHAQGDEGVTVLYQEDRLKFRAERVIRLSPVYGSSWFELFDYDGDGDNDIALANGDNADLSFLKKPYHGLRVFINEGERGFLQRYFYPLPGATRVAANDFDGDGDVDFAVSCFFPDYEEKPEESFVYLENIDAANFRFTTYTINDATKGRWIVMEQGDFDGDGDIDLVLGSFIHSPAPTPDTLLNEWKQSKTDLLLLENQLLH